MLGPSEGKGEPTDGAGRRKNNRSDKGEMEMKKHRILRNLLIDVLLTGAALVVFALFHHVLPRQQQSLGIVISNPYQTEEAGTGANSGRILTEEKGAASSLTLREENGTGSGLTLPEGAMVIASAGMSDSGSLSARGGRQNGGRGGRNGSNGSGGKGGSALTEEGTESAAGTEENGESGAAADTPISEKFTDKYTDTVVATENSYSSPDLAITVTRETLGRTTYYLADIYVRDITCFQSALARNTYGSGYRDSIADMAALNSALLAVNGDYYGNTNEGVVIRNGVIYRANPTNCDVCVLYYDGTMRVMPGSAFSVEEAVAQGAWQAWTFGPALLNTDGSVLTSFSSTGRIISANPRTAIGYYEPGHYCMVVVDGRGESAGISLPDLSQLFYDLGCTAAYNLDGGNSSIMVWNNEVINDPSGGGRESSDALLIAEVKSYE